MRGQCCKHDAWRHAGMLTPPEERERERKKVQRSMQNEASVVGTNLQSAFSARLTKKKSAPIAITKKKRTPFKPLHCSRLMRPGSIVTWYYSKVSESLYTLIRPPGSTKTTDLGLPWGFICKSSRLSCATVSWLGCCRSDLQHERCCFLL